MPDEKQIKPVVVAIICKQFPDELRIMTQMRNVHDHDYDRLYHGRQEAVGETLRPGEDVLAAVMRGIREECGMQVDPWRIHGNLDDLMRYPEGGKQLGFWWSHRGDRIILCEPFALVQSVGEPQLWFGPVFLVSVPLSWEPNFKEADGEATEHQWWKPRDLLEETLLHPEKFMGLHMPALRLLAKECTEYRG